MRTEKCDICYIFFPEVKQLYCGLNSVIMHPLEASLYCQFFTVPPVSSIWFLSIVRWRRWCHAADIMISVIMKTDEIFLFLGKVNFFTFLMCENSARVFSHQFHIVVNTITYCTKGFYFQPLFFYVNNKGMNSCLWINPMKFLNIILQ